VGAEHDGYQTSFDPVPGVVVETPRNSAVPIYVVLAAGRQRHVHARWLYRCT
jgi:hypothetical protein